MNREKEEEIFRRDRHGTPMVVTKVISSERKDVCQDCARKIQFFIDCVLPMTDDDISIKVELPDNYVILNLKKE